MQNIDQYGDFTQQMWMSKDDDRGLAIMSLGLGGEAGELMAAIAEAQENNFRLSGSIGRTLEIVKKHFRDGKLDLEALKKELGDVAYYWARICRYFGFQPSEVLQANIDKLESRRSRGTLRGDGDDR